MTRSGDVVTTSFQRDMCKFRTERIFITTHHFDHLTPPGTSANASPAGYPSLPIPVDLSLTHDSSSHDRTSALKPNRLATNLVQILQLTSWSLRPLIPPSHSPPHPTPRLKCPGHAQTLSFLQFLKYNHIALMIEYRSFA